MHRRKTIKAGKEWESAEKALILIHGRGGNAQDILSLVNHLNVPDFVFLAPQATNNTWYPYSFMAPVFRNEPWLSSALESIANCVKECIAAGIDPENIFFLGFSQGACLTLEFVARNGKKYGGVVAFTGGLIGAEIAEENYRGDFSGTPFFISSGNPDPHIPVGRVKDSEAVLKKMNGRVDVEIYEGRPHSISRNEMKRVNELIFI